MSIPDSWHDEISGNINISDEDKRIAKNMVIIKSDGSPSYHFATVIDDYLMGINAIIRGNDHTSNCGRHHVLYNVFDFPLPKFFHIGLIFYKKRKMSKRDNAASILWLKEQGYDKDAVENALLRLGWSPSKDNKENSILPRDRAIKMFLSEGKMRPSPSNFDQNKLNWFNKKYRNFKRNI